MDYLSAQSNSMAFCLSVETLLGVEVPERVRNIRVLLAELQRINSHLVWLGTHGGSRRNIGDVVCFRERERCRSTAMRASGCSWLARWSRRFRPAATTSGVRELSAKPAIRGPADENDLQSDEGVGGFRRGALDGTDGAHRAGRDADDAQVSLPGHDTRVRGRWAPGRRLIECACRCAR
jgi:hypothetical protein